MHDVSIRLPSEREEFADHLADFERWFVDVQRRYGMQGDPLQSIEHNILRAYITWLREHAGRGSP